MTSAERHAAFGADAADLGKIETFGTAAGLKVLETSQPRRSVLLSGTVAAFSRAFGVELKLVEGPRGRYRGRRGPITVPRELDGVIDAVFGLDNRPMGSSYLRKHSSTLRGASGQNVYLPPQVAQLYNFPQGTDGAGQCIVIFAFNGQIGSTGISAKGGYNIDALRTYFAQFLHLNPPEIVDKVVHGPGNVPGDESSDTDVSGEVMLDIQVAGSCAPGARLVMYFTEFTEQGWVDAITSAVTDDENQPSIISISYGNPEDGGNQTLWTKAAIRVVNNSFQRAALAGITICCAAGDDGSSDAISDTRVHVDFPSSSPYVLGCGGTRLQSNNGVITKETVWNDGPGSATGGGISALFALPDYQRAAGIPASVNPGHRIGRGVPDVSGLADPATGLAIMSNSGQLEPSSVGGTSATAPLWAALVARINQALKTRVGFLNPLLYRFATQGVLRDITVGDNGAYSASTGWDACTGLGSPDGARLLALLQQIPSLPPHLAPLSAPPPVPVQLSRLEAEVSASMAERALQRQQLTRIEGLLTQLAAAVTRR
jgi:kumamolisin